MYTPSSKSGDVEPESRIRPAVSAGGSGLIPSSEQRRFRRRCHSTQGAAFPHSRTSVKAFFVDSVRRIRLEADPRWLLASLLSPPGATATDIRQVISELQHVSRQQRTGGSSRLLASQPSDPGADAPPFVPSVSC